MTQEEKIKQSITRQCKAIFPNTLNANETLFGGHVMQWMDEVAYITATRFARQRMFTISTDKIKFLKPVFADTVVELVGRVVRVGMVKLFVRVDVFMEEMYSVKREKVIEADFVFAALDADRKPVRIQAGDH